MTLAEFVSRHPRLYHRTLADAWPRIRAWGLLSTAALLDRFEINGPARARIERERRPESVVIEHPQHGRVRLNDQRPLSDATLAPALRDGLAPADWYALLNARVFFWVDEDRLARMLGTYQRWRNVVLVLDTARVLADHAPRVTLSAINSGYSLRAAQPRGCDTFCRLGDFATHRFNANGKRIRREVAECALDYALPNVENYLVELREPKSSSHA